MRHKVNSATKKFLFDHVWGLPYNPRMPDAIARKNSPMNVLYLREKEGEVPRMCGSSALGSAVLGSSVPGLQWVVRGEGELERRGWAITWLLLIILAFITCLVTLLTLTGNIQITTTGNVNKEFQIPRPF